MTQQHKQRPQAESKVEEVVATEAPQGAEKTEGLDADIDAILDEIDAVLEVNAEEFVAAFIQKGGE